MNNKNELFYLLVDGNDFKSYTYLCESSNIIKQVNHVLIEGGDNKYCSIAAASIIAKVERDKYIKEMCNTFPKLDICYGLLTNKGYGTAKHMEGMHVKFCYATKSCVEMIESFRGNHRAIWVN